MSPVGRASVAYIMFFSAIGASIPYVPVFFRSIGLGIEAIGLLSALSAGVGLAAAPAWGAIADRLGALRGAIVVAGLWAAAAAGWLALARDPLSVTAAIVVLGIGLAGIGPMLDARTVELLGADRDRYGRSRAWGSIAFIASALVVGAIIDRSTPVGLFVVYVPALALTSIAVYALMGAPHSLRGAGLQVTLADLGQLVRDRAIGLFLIGAVLVWTALSAVNTFFSIHVVDVGGAAQTVGVAWALGAIIEVPIMWAYPAIATRVGTERLLVLAAFVWAVRAAGFALFPDPAALAAISLLGGIAFALFYVGTVTYVARHAPPGLRATAQGIFTGSAMGIGMVLGSMIAGFVAAALTIPGLFAACAVGTVLAAAVVAWAVLPARRAAALPLSGKR